MSTYCGCCGSLLSGQANTEEVERLRETLRLIREEFRNPEGYDDGDPVVRLVNDALLDPPRAGKENRLMTMFRGGPLGDGRQSQIHSLIVHLQGDGRHSIGAYVQVHDEDVPLGVFEWHAETDVEAVD